ncbi:hypothetical protein GCM10027589_40520 [Actinocorallia lasiicapitis]
MAVVAAVAVALLLVLRGGGGDAVAAPVPSPTGSVTGTVPPAPGEAGSGIDLPETTIAPETDEPVVREYADELSGRVHTPGAAPTVRTTVEPGYDGCDHGYGSPGQCVPWDFPSAVRTPAGKCAWLKGAGFAGPLAVRGADRHGLDPDRNGLACEK